MRLQSGKYIRAIKSDLCKSLKVGYAIGNVSQIDYKYTCELLEHIESQGFDYRKIIIVNEYNMLIDGQHRLYYFINKTDLEKIPVLKLHLKRENFMKKVLKTILANYK